MTDIEAELLALLKDKIIHLCDRRLVDCIDDLRDILAEIDRLAGVEDADDYCD